MLRAQSTPIPPLTASTIRAIEAHATAAGQGSAAALALATARAMAPQDARRSDLIALALELRRASA